MATKKITELPFINTLSGSSVFDNPTQNTVVPVVLYGTTNQITVENFSKFINLYAAQTGSQNIFTQNQWFNATVSASTINVGTLGVGGNTTIAGTLGVTGNGTIGGNLAVAGRITAEEFYTEITTASVIYASGSTKFGDDTGDTHEFTGSINVSGSVIYNGVILSNIDANTIQRLQQTTQSLQVATASLQTFTASQDDRNFILSQVTGSFAGEIGGLEEYTASLKTAAIVSSSTQIQNYNLFAVTSSDNTFYGTQRITGSLSVSRGQFNVVTASGGLTSSLTFTHNITSPGDGNAILELRHNNRIYNDDIAIKLKADFAGAYLDYEEDTVPYSILSVQSFANKNVYIHQDTRLLFSNLTVDDNLVVKQDTKMTGSLFVMGVITGSILATNGVISSSNQLFELNQFTASQDDRNFTLSQVTGSLIGITNGLMAFTAALDNTYATDAQLYQLYQATRSIELTTGSLIGITNGLMAFTAALDSTYATDAQLYQLYQSTQSLELHSGSMVGVTNGLMAYTASNETWKDGVRGEISGIEAWTASLDSLYATDAQLFQLYQATRSIELTTGSLIGITNGLMAFTAALDSTYATDAQLYQLYQATQSLELLSGSLIGITNGLMAFTAALDSTYATDAQLYQLYQATQSLELHSGSMIGITNALMAFTAALDSTYATDAQLYQLYAETASIKAEIGGIEAYTASLKGAAIVSSSQQITNYYKFAETASANTTFYGNVTASGNLQANQLYIGGATTSTGLIGASEAVVQNELGIQFGDATGTYMRLIANTANSNTAIVAGAFSGAEPPLDLIVGGATQMRLRADGNNGINTTAPVFTGLTGSLTIYKSYNNDIASVPSTTAQSYYSNQSGLYLFGRNSGISIIGGNSEEATICYGNASTNRFASISVGTGTDAVGGDLYVKVGSDTERLRIAATTGNLTVSTGNLVIGTAGKGIDFSATANSGSSTPSELLNDYEEGTWTATATYSGTNTPTHAYQTGHYTKIGRVVQIQALISWNENGSTGDLTITGLPFTSNNTVGRAVTSMMNIGFSGLTTNLVGEVESNSTLIKIRKADNAGTLVTATDTDNDQDLYISCTYMV